MDSELSELVVVIGEDPVESSKVWDAVKWIAAKPEGLVLLKKAFALHHAPITIFSHPQFVHLGYGANHEHVILVNSPVLDSHLYHGQNGEIIRGSLERYLSHEFTHAAQPGALSLHDFEAAFAETVMATISESIPFEQYSNRLKAAKDNDALLRNVLENMYDIHIAPHGQKIMETFKYRLGNDPRVQAYVKQYEIPAIEFENHMMEYKGEPKRSTDYIESAIYDELLSDKTFQALDRENFVNGALLEIKATLSQSGQRSNPEIKGI